MDDLLTELQKPFHPSQIQFRPGAKTRNGQKALGLPYADARAYMERLDTVCGLDWEVTYEPWGTARLVCRVTIGGVTRSSTGEADNEGDRAEIAGTVAEAQAFKRACAMFGLGRYLYRLPAMWAEYQGKGFTEQGLAKLKETINKYYQRHQEGIPDPEEGGWTLGTNATKREHFHTIGQKYYGDRWVEARQQICDKAGVSSSSELLVTDAMVVINELIERMEE